MMGKRARGRSLMDLARGSFRTACIRLWFASHVTRGSAHQRKDLAADASAFAAA